MVSYSQGRMMRSTLATAKRHKSRLVLLGAGRKRVRLDTPALTGTREGLDYEPIVNRADERGVLLESVSRVAVRTYTTPRRKR